jgi:hypothetical protein
MVGKGASIRVPFQFNFLLFVASQSKNGEVSSVCVCTRLCSVWVVHVNALGYGVFFSCGCVPCVCCVVFECDRCSVGGYIRHRGYRRDHVGVGRQRCPCAEG